MLGRQVVKPKRTQEQMCKNLIKHAKIRKHLEKCSKTSEKTRKTFKHFAKPKRKPKTTKTGEKPSKP